MYQKWPPFLTFYLRYCKDIANLLLWVIWECLIMPINNDNINLVGNVDAQSVEMCVILGILGMPDHTPKMIIAIWRNLWRLSVGKGSSSFFTFSLRYYKDTVNLLFWVLWAYLVTQTDLLDWNSPCRGDEDSHQKNSTQVHQREELNWASQLKSSDQQIFSTMSST